MCEILQGKPAIKKIAYFMCGYFSGKTQNGEFFLITKPFNITDSNVEHKLTMQFILAIAASFRNWPLYSKDKT